MRAKKKVVRHEKTIKKMIEAFTGSIRIIFIYHCVVCSFLTCTELFIDTLCFISQVLTYTRHSGKLPH